MSTTYEELEKQHRQRVADRQRIQPGQPGYNIQEALNDALGVELPLGVLRTEAANEAAMMRFFQLKETEEDRVAYDAAYPEQAAAKQAAQARRKGRKRKGAGGET